MTTKLLVVQHLRMKRATNLGTGTGVIKDGVSLMPLMLFFSISGESTPPRWTFISDIDPGDNGPANGCGAGFVTENARGNGEKSAIGCDAPACPSSVGANRCACCGEYCCSP